MKNTLLTLIIVVSTLLVSGCGCGFNSGCCSDTTVSICSMGNDGW